MEKIKTKEYAINDDLVINKVTVNYCTESDIDDSDNELKLSIAHQGAGFYYVMKTKRFAFDDIDFMIRILQDFKEKANIDDYSERDTDVPHKTNKQMKKLVRELEVGEKIELLNGTIGVISGVAINEYKKEAIILYENGMKTYCLPNEEVEIL